MGLLLASLRLHGLPCGAAGFSLRLLLFDLGTAADLLTAHLVVGQTAQTRCAFGQGLIFDSAPPSNAYYSQWPCCRMRNCSS